MTAPGDNKPTVWQELVQRRVVRVAIYYGAIAWALVQVADVVLEAFEADAILKYVIAAAVAGFPVAMVLSWMFDITPQGIVRTPASEPGEPGERSSRSIAVLPFANLSDDPDNEYFSDGLADEIRDRIAQVPGMRVAARSSSSAFKGKVLDARDIGRQLDVSLLLEGGVRKYRDTLRVSAQLVDTHRGYQVWSRSFEKRLEDVFAVQAEIAHAILEAVHVQVVEPANPMATPANVEAYNLYLLGRYHFHRRTEASLSLAVRYFRRAIGRDPQYAQAYSGLADAMCLLGTGFYGNMSAAESLAEAIPAVTRALEIAPQSAEAHASTGLIRHLQDDLDGAVRALEHAIELNPNYALAYVWLALVLQSQSRYREAAKRNAEALRLDPLSPIVNANVGFDALRLGNHVEAETRFQAVIELDATFPVGYSGMARLRLMQGRLDDALDWQEQAIEHAPTVAYYLARKGFILLLAGCSEAARAWFASARRSSLDKHYMGDILVGVAAAAGDLDALRAIRADDEAFGDAERAFAALLLGDTEQALALYRDGVPGHATVLRDMVNYETLWRIPHCLYRALGERRQHGRDVRDELESFLAAEQELWDQGIANADTHYWAAASHALLGRTDNALDEMKTAVELGWRNLWWARRDPCFDGMREDSQFARQLAEVEQAIHAASGNMQTCHA